jgi:hypothetical protein
MPQRFDIRALAKRIHARRRDFEREFHVRVPVTPGMSRLLEHDDEYLPYRPRIYRPQRRKLVYNPSIAGLIEIAESLHTTVGELLGERGFQFTNEDRRALRSAVRTLI